MNGVHDLGGMQGFGPVHPEVNEPVFHAPWEGRVIAIRRVLGAIGKVRPSGFRPTLEGLPPADYLSHSYYHNWLDGLVHQLLEAGVVTLEELAVGHPAKAGAPVVAMKPADAVTLPFRIPPALVKANVMRRFKPGDHVRARNLNPTGHTRLPRYVRGKAGVIAENRGVQALADTNAYGRAENARAVYAVRFTARELWGHDASSRDAVYVDLWEDYLEHA